MMAVKNVGLQVAVNPCRYVKTLNRYHKMQQNSDVQT